MTEEPKMRSINDLPPEIAHLYSLMKVEPVTEKGIAVKLLPAELPNGRLIMTDGRLGMSKWDPHWDGHPLIVPTLHVRSPTDNREYGEGLQSVCEPSNARQFLHTKGHDFPSGFNEMKKIAQLIRATAESAS